MGTSMLRESNNGCTMIELALGLSFLLMLILGVSDALIAFQRFQYLSVVSRELGNAAFRSCTELSPGTQTENCLQDAAQRALELVNGPNGVLQGTEVVVVVYRWTTTGPAIKGRYSNGSQTTRFAPSDIQNLASYYAQRQTVVTSEVFFQGATYSPWFTDNSYEVTIF